MNKITDSISTQYMSIHFTAKLISQSISFNTNSVWYKIWSRDPETELLKEKLKSDYSRHVFVEAHMVLYNESTILMWGKNEHHPVQNLANMISMAHTHTIFAQHKDTVFMQRDNFYHLCLEHDLYNSPETYYS
jgi:hypothetical protein